MANGLCWFDAWEALSEGERKAIHARRAKDRGMTLGEYDRWRDALRERRRVKRANTPIRKKEAQVEARP